MRFQTICKVFAAFASFVASSAIDHQWRNDLASRQEGGNLVFAHFMIGIVGGRSGAADYDDDMRRARAAGIDAFALNIGVDPFSEDQLNYAYESAASNDMKVFISFDFNWFTTGEAARVGEMIARYGSKPAQLIYEDKAFASSFAGDGLNVQALRDAAGIEVFWAPNFHPEEGTDFSPVDSALNWMAWENDGNNKAAKPGANVTVKDGDDAYLATLGDKPYMAPVSPWFYTHFGPEVSYSKNWVFSNLGSLWYDRWNQILEMQPRFIEIITWNDYGEAHYVGRLDSPHGDDGNSKWVYGFPHNGWLDMAVPFIQAYREGASEVGPYITEDKVVYWYRPTLKALDCDATDTTMEDADNSTGNYFKGRPNGWETMEDKVYVVTLLTEGATLNMNAGDNSATIEVPAGASIHTVDMAPGAVSFGLHRNDNVVLEGTSDLDILDHCPCGIYNFNPFVGSLPSGEPDELLPEGYANIMTGLKVSTCGPTGMLATSAPEA